MMSVDTTRNMTELDRAIVAHRENPTPYTERRLARLQREHVDGFYANNATEYIGRTTK